MEKRESYYSIMSVRLKKKEAEAYCEKWSKEHFLPADRFKVIAVNDHFRVVYKVYERELSRFGYKNLKNYHETLIRQTLKVKKWLCQARRRSI